MKKKKKAKEGKAKSVVQFLKKQTHQFVDQKFQEAHEEVFEESSFWKKNAHLLLVFYLLRFSLCKILKKFISIL